MSPNTAPESPDTRPEPSPHELHGASQRPLRLSEDIRRLVRNVLIEKDNQEDLPEDDSRRSSSPRPEAQPTHGIPNTVHMSRVMEVIKQRSRHSQRGGKK